jgi:riboflavin synthase
MFTGIVDGLGEVVALEREDGAAQLTVKGRNGMNGMAGTAPGDSVAVNGACLTVTAIAGGVFTADVMGETLQRTNLGSLAPGAAVNLERPCRAGEPLGGHLVQGHVDGTGEIISRTREPHWEVVRITLPHGLARYVAEKGSIAVDGASLTVSAVSDAPGEPWFEVSLIPFTLELTTLGRKRPGELVNLEVDVLAKYVERLLGGRRG